MSYLQSRRAGGGTDEEIDRLIKKLSSKEVIERGERLNREFNNFSIAELLKPFNI